MPVLNLHGPNVIEINDGARPIRSVNTSVIIMPGTAPDADLEVFPYGKPVLITGGNSEMLAALDTTGNKAGTLPNQLDWVYKQIGAAVIVINQEQLTDEGEQATAMIEAVQAIYDAKSETGLKPSILAAPGFSHIPAVGAELVSVAEKTLGFAYLAAPAASDAEAIAYRDNFNNKHCMIFGNHIQGWDASVNDYNSFDPTGAIAGLRAKVDQQVGPWESISNHSLNGVTGLNRPIYYQHGNANTQANILNMEHEISVVLRESGFRSWGNRTPAADSDPEFIFESVVRTDNFIKESLLLSHLWAVDRGITKTYVNDVAEGVKGFLDDLTARGGILGGDVWTDESLATPQNIKQGKVYWDYDVGFVYPAENPTFRRRITNRFIPSLIAD